MHAGGGWVLFSVACNFFTRKIVAFFLLFSHFSQKILCKSNTICKYYVSIILDYNLNACICDEIVKKIAKNRALVIISHKTMNLGKKEYRKWGGCRHNMVKKIAK